MTDQGAPPPVTTSYAVGGTIVDMSSIRSAVLGVATVAVASVAAYLGVILMLATSDAVGNVLEGDRYGMAAFIVLVTGAVLAGAAAVIWVARRDGHSWWRAARRASAVLILGTYAVAMIHVALAAPF